MAEKQHQVIVLGGGAAGLTVAFGGAAAGIDMALVERGPIGGECTWRGCVPSKTLIDIARRAHEARSGTRKGLEVSSQVRVDMRSVMEHVHRVSHRVAAEEDEKALTEAGVTVYQGSARFIDAHTIEIRDGLRVSGGRLVIATGGTPRVPEIFRPVPHWTSDTIWALDMVPERLIVVGGGPVGAELGQAFARLGAEVVIVTQSEALLATDDATKEATCPHAGEAIGRVLAKEDVEIITGAPVIAARLDGDHVEIELEDGHLVRGSHLLVAAGQVPNLEDLQLEAAGVQVDDGLVLDEKLTTTQEHIFACGDVAGAGFTHIASDQASGVLLNLVSPYKARVDTSPRRWATFTDPEVAQVGLSCAEARRRHSRAEVTSIPVERADRAITQGAEDGFIEIVHSAWGKILGVTVVAPNAAEWANQWIPHIGKRMSAPILTPTIYPTLGSTNAVVGYLWADAKVRGSWLGRWARRLIGRLMDRGER